MRPDATRIITNSNFSYTKFPLQNGELNSYKRPFSVPTLSG